nr:MAG TPA: hypothetical protein [Bacteriophage sp.]DAQ71965.1 MAG TPA: hypothetical protein [Caudoviricetes sp.]
MGNVCSVNCNADGFYTRLVNGEFSKTKRSQYGHRNYSYMDFD